MQLPYVVVSHHNDDDDDFQFSLQDGAGDYLYYLGASDAARELKIMN